MFLYFLLGVRLVASALRRPAHSITVPLEPNSRVFEKSIYVYMCVCVNISMPATLVVSQVWRAVGDGGDMAWIGLLYS